MVQLQAGATPRPKDQRYVRLDERIAKYKTNFWRELLNCPDMGRQMLAAKRYLARCACMMYGVDSAGLSRKAARAVSKKYTRLVASSWLSSWSPLRSQPPMQPTELSWASEQSWLEQSPSKELPLSTEQPLPWIFTNIMATDFDRLCGKIIDSYLALVYAWSQLTSRQRAYSFKTHFYTMLCNPDYAGAKSWIKINAFS
uniref:Uncharacterized protein n=1 Tax=Plectus sambesii TaxID=2011161 RepID=A0A914UU28_9BILA